MNVEFGRRIVRFPDTAWVIGLLLVGLGYALAFLLDGSAPSLLAQVASKDWPSTPGIIIYSDIVEISSVDEESSYKSDIRTGYKVDGKAYQLFEVYPGHSGLGSNSNVEAVRLSSRYPVGKSVPVYVNPREPKEAVLETGVHGKTLVTLAFAFVPTALGLWLLLWGIRETWRWMLQSVKKTPKSSARPVDVTDTDPDLILKLLEVYLTADNDAAFIATAKQYRNRLSASDWKKVQKMGRTNGRIS